jgi:hypothetical protein
VFENHLVSERSLKLFQGVRFQQLGQSLATTFAKQSRLKRQAVLAEEVDEEEFGQTS